MQPEDIDKLFRDQLQHHAPTPPAYLWEQLEAEIRPAKKRPALWLYAAAAMIALLIVAGGGWLLRPYGSAATTGTLATNGSTGRQASTSETVAATATKKSTTTQATTNNEPASSRLEDQQTPLDVAAATPATTETAAVSTLRKPAATLAAAATNIAPTRQASASKAVAATRNRATAQPKLLTPAAQIIQAVAATAAQPEHPSLAATATKINPTSTSPAPPTGAIEVEVHRGTEPSVALAAADVPQPYASDSHLKNLFHKAKSAVKEGRVKLPRVELPETVTVQVNVFSHSATKVIQL